MNNRSSQTELLHENSVRDERDAGDSRGHELRAPVLAPWRVHLPSFIGHLSVVSLQTPQVQLEMKLPVRSTNISYASTFQWYLTMREDIKCGLNRDLI